MISDFDLLFDILSCFDTDFNQIIVNFSIYNENTCNEILFIMKSNECCTVVTSDLSIII